MRISEWSADVCSSDLQHLGMTLQELLQSRMHKGAALGGAGIGIERVERPQMQNLASVKGIGIAHPGLDARDRELARSGGSRRAGQRRPDRHDLSRGIESCRPGLPFRLLVAQTVGEPQALAEGVEARQHYGYGRGGDKRDSPGGGGQDKKINKNDTIV